VQGYDFGARNLFSKGGYHITQPRFNEDEEACFFVQRKSVDVSIRLSLGVIPGM
jgi:hypothetical protein